MLSPLSVGRLLLRGLVLVLGAESSVFAQGDRLQNLSSSAWVGQGDEVLIAGFSIAPGPAKRVLVRAIGPALTGYGVGNAMADPELEIVDVDGNVVANNASWPAVLASTFDELGAFALPLDSADAALVAELAPGNYSAVVHATGGFGFGQGVVEVYDLAGPTRLTNLSTRARVDSDRSLVIAGLVVGADGGDRRLLFRAVGPSLAAYGVNAPLGDPAITIVRQADGVHLDGNDNWGDSPDAAVLNDTFAAAGAFPLLEGSADAALLAELPAGGYTLLVSGVNGAAGPALVEVYDLTPTESATVSVTALNASTDTAPGSAPATFRVHRVGSTADALTVNLDYGGTAAMGADYVNAPRTITLAPGEASATIAITPYPNTDVQTFNKSVTLSVAPGSGYGAGLQTTAEATIFYSAGTLYVINLLPTSPGSNAYGTVTIQLASDESALIVSSRVANLSSPETSAYLRLGAPGEDGDYLFALPSGQATNVQWDLQAVGAHSPADILAALREGRIQATIGSTQFPSGELSGAAVRYAGSRTFTAPSAAPAAPTAPTTRAEAARFLTQATFGPTPDEVTALLSQTYAQWIDAQMALPASNHLAETRAELDRWGEPNFADRPDQQHRIGAWWNITLRGEDQLRQRVAFALSEILVISDENGTIYNWQEGAAHYLDILAANAFGNFRDLLEDVTLSPVMGTYLSHLRNAKADPETGSVPDENFAREIMQLFSIGLVELHPDGTLRLDGNGLPIPTYDQTTITEMAKVFTGWSFYHADPQPWRFRWTEPEFLRPMINYPDYHEDGAKRIVTGRELPAGQGALKDLRDTLDTLFLHENTGPFIARRLIQRLVTSNPSPGYVYRVAQVFANNGAGVRGDLGAVVRAILLDHEARSADAASAPNFGKLKEPLLRVTNLLRAFDGASASGRIYYFWSQGELSQAPLRSPSVFNFFTPDYVPPGNLAAAGLFAPEMQIHTDTTALGVPNRLAVYSFSNWGDPANREADDVILDIADLLPLYATPGALLDELNARLCAGSMDTATRERILQAHAELPGWVSARQGVSSLIYLTVTSPAAAVQN